MVHQSQFIEMFGLPSANHKAFSVGSIADVVSDVHYGTSRQSNENGDYPYLRMNNITYEGDLDLSDLKKISVPKEELSGCLVKKGDVLFNRTNSKDLVGKTCCFSLEQPMVIAGYIIRLRMNGLVLPEYLSVFLNLPGSKKLLRNISKGAVGQANINAKEVQSISVLIPPIELQNQFVALKKQADKSKFGGLKSQFIEMFVNRGLPIRHLPDISENLDSRRIPITSGSRVHGPYPYYGASGIVDYVEDFIFDEELLLISEDGANLKDRVTPIAFVAQGKYWVNNHAHILRFKCKEMQTYVEHLINYLNVEVYLTGMAQPKLNQEQLNSIPIPIPNEDRLDSFYLVVCHADKSKYLS